MQLSSNDLDILNDEIKKLSKDESQRIKTLEKVKKGFEDYATEDMIEGDREIFLRDGVKKLLQRLSFAGKTTNQAFDEGLLDYIRNTLNALGVPSRDLDDLTSDCAVKIFRFKYIEQYNPLKSGWSNFISILVRRMRASYYEKRSRDPIALGFNYQSYNLNPDISGESEDFRLELYTNEGLDLTGLERLLVAEILDDFRKYLAKQKTKRLGRVGKVLGTCVIHPPVTKKQKKKIRDLNLITEPQRVLLIRKGETTCHRVQTLDGSRLLWPKELVTDISLQDEKTELRFFSRSILDFYDMLMETGAQVNTLASHFKVADSTIHAWISSDGNDGKPETWGLERHFREWWKISDVIPFSQKWRARKTVKCPNCHYEHLELPTKVAKEGVIWYTRFEKLGNILHPKVYYTTPDCRLLDGEVRTSEIIEANWCDECGKTTLEHIDFKYEIPYPWGKIRGHEDLISKSAQYKPKMQVPLCKV